MSKSFNVEEENTSESESYSSSVTSTSSSNDYEEKQRASVEDAVLEPMSQLGFGRERSESTQETGEGARVANAAFTTTRSAKIISNDENIIQVQPRPKVRLGRGTIVEKEQVTEELDSEMEKSIHEPTSPNPITIASIENGKLKVDDNALYQLLMREDVKGRPLIIISIAGVFRSGKSLLLNFFIRYLQNHGWENPSWLGGDDSNIPGCNESCSSDFYFSWKRGDEGCSKGVLVCPDVFQIPLKDGRNAAVLLIDTQGLYDEVLTPELESRLMSISMIFSSCQMINIMRQINSRHFADIELWCSLAAASADLQPTEEYKVFQDLTILIRDYESGEHPFGDSKGSYLGSVVTRMSKTPQMKKTSAAVTNAFKGVKCILMPHPGSRLTSHSKPNLANKDVKKKFLKVVRQFVESMFDRDMLTAKTISGHEADSFDVLNMLGKLGQAYKNGDGPTIKTVMQSAADATNTTALRKAISEYREHMKRRCPAASDKVLTAEEMSKANEEAMKLAEACFNRHKTLGSDEDGESFLNQCKRECGQCEFTAFNNQNVSKKERILNKCRAEFQESRKAYNNTLRQVGVGGTMREFVNKHEQAKEQILKGFDEIINDFKIAVPEVLKWRTLLEDEIQYIYQPLKHERERAQLVILPNHQKQNSPERHMLEGIARFRNNADEFNRCHSYSDAVEKKLTESRDELMEEYDRNTNALGDHSDVIKYRTGLERELDIIFSKAVWLNNNKKEILEGNCKAFGRGAGEMLVNSLENIMLQSHVEKQCFEKYVEEFLSISVPPGDKLPDWGKEIFIKAIKERAAEYEEKNKKDERFRSVFLTKINFSERIGEFRYAIFKLFSSIFNTSLDTATGSSEASVSATVSM